MRSLLICFFTITVLASCNKSDLLKYNAGSDIYFSYRYNSVQSDSVNISFGQSDIVQTAAVDFNVCILGKVLADNRTYTIRVDEARSTAVAGKHYQLPVADSLYIKGGQSLDTVTIRAFRPADLRDASVVLYLELVPDNHFKTGMPTYSNTLNATKLRIIIDDILPQPANWALSEDFLGKFSREKIIRMAAQLNLSMTSFYPLTPGGVVYTATQLSNFSRQFQTYLNQQATAGNVIREKDGSPMVMGPAAQ